MGWCCWDASPSAAARTGLLQSNCRRPVLDKLCGTDGSWTFRLRVCPRGSSWHDRDYFKPQWYSSRHRWINSGRALSPTGWIPLTLLRSMVHCQLPFDGMRSVLGLLPFICGNLHYLSWGTMSTWWLTSSGTGFLALQQIIRNLFRWSMPSDWNCITMNWTFMSTTIISLISH